MFEVQPVIKPFGVHKNYFVIYLDEKKKRKCVIKIRFLGMIHFFFNWNQEIISNRMNIFINKQYNVNIYCLILWEVAS